MAKAVVVLILVCMFGATLQRVNLLRKSSHKYGGNTQLMESVNLYECREYCDDAYKEYLRWYIREIDHTQWTAYADICQHYVKTHTSGNKVDRSLQNSRKDAAIECAINYFIKEIGACE